MIVEQQKLSYLCGYGTRERIWTVCHVNFFTFPHSILTVVVWCEGSWRVFTLCMYIMYALPQETHQDLAEKSGLHVVEMRRELDYRPVVVASPTSSSKAAKGVVRDLKTGSTDAQEHHVVSST